MSAGSEGLEEGGLRCAAAAPSEVGREVLLVAALAGGWGAGRPGAESSERSAMRDDRSAEDLLAPAAERPERPASGALPGGRAPAAGGAAAGAARPARSSDSCAEETLSPADRLAALMGRWLRSPAADADAVP
jgi:hypothetical protein